MIPGCMHVPGTEPGGSIITYIEMKIENSRICMNPKFCSIPLLFLMLLLSCNGQEELPNILWVVIEDTSPQFIGCYGNEHVKTPNFDRLAREGVMFTSAYATGPVCSAARSTIITGVNTEQLGTGNHRSRYPIPGYMTGFPSYLRGKGYYTTNNVKKDYNTSNEPEIVSASWDADSRKAGWWGKRDEQPFFSVFNFGSCHQSSTMTNPWNWYVEHRLNRLEEKDRTRPDEIEVPPIFRDSKEMRRNLSRVYNSINLTDIEVGMLLDSLQRHGLMESTIIFFYGDHGEAIPRGKASSIGLSYRVPFIIWFPEKYKHLSPWKTGQATDEVISFEDLAPTMLSLGGLEPPAYMTGRPFLGKYREEPREYVYGSRNRLDETPGLARTLTDGRYFYVRVFQPRYPGLRYQKYLDVSDINRLIRKEYAEGKLDKNQSLMLERREHEYLYDLVNDPWEVNNLAGNPDFADVLVKMRTALYERLVSDRDVLFLPEYEIARISKRTTPYEYRLEESFRAREVIDAAYEATSPAANPEKLLAMLESDSPVIRYWSVVGIHNLEDRGGIPAGRILAAMSDPYPPVAIEAAGIACEDYGNPLAYKVLERFMLEKDYCLSLQALQMVEYLPEPPPELLDVAETVLDKRTREVDGYEYDYDLCVCCEMILYLHRGRPLYYESVKKWEDPAQLGNREMVPAP
jgi:arylsulfatase A-like enzyme